MDACATSSEVHECPERQARAACWAGSGRAPHARLHAAPASLQGALVVVACRDTRGVALDAAQRLSHFPATPLLCLSWYLDMEAGLVAHAADGRSRWQPFGAQVVLSGSQNAPVTSWSPTTGRGGMACFTLDAAQALFGIDCVALQDRFVAAPACLGPAWQPLCEDLVAALDDAQALAALERHLAPRWRELQGRAGDAPPSLSEFGRHWVARLGLQARQWQSSLGLRQVERRIKLASGRSIRQWQGMVRTESLFHAARRHHEQGQALDWAALALDEGFSDQAHMCRAVRQITGFSPGEFARRFEHDESFWMYRLWV